MEPSLLSATASSGLDRVLGNTDSIPFLWPELVLTLGVLGVIVFDLAAPKEVRLKGVIAIALTPAVYAVHTFVVKVMKIEPEPHELKDSSH